MEDSDCALSCFWVSSAAARKSSYDSIAGMSRRPCTPKGFIQVHV